MTSTTIGSPASEYRARLRARQETRARWTAIDARVSYTRLVTFFAAVALAAMGWWGLVTWWLLSPLGNAGLWLAMLSFFIARGVLQALRYPALARKPFAPH